MRTLSRDERTKHGCAYCKDAEVTRVHIEGKTYDKRMSVCPHDGGCPYAEQFKGYNSYAAWYKAKFGANDLRDDD